MKQESNTHDTEIAGRPSDWDLMMDSGLFEDLMMHGDPKQWTSSHRDYVKGKWGTLQSEVNQGTPISECLLKRMGDSAHTEKL